MLSVVVSVVSLREGGWFSGREAAIQGSSYNPRPSGPLEHERSN